MLLSTLKHARMKKRQTVVIICPPTSVFFCPKYLIGIAASPLEIMLVKYMMLIATGT